MNDKEMTDAQVLHEARRMIAEMDPDERRLLTRMLAGDRSALREWEATASTSAWFDSHSGVETEEWKGGRRIHRKAAPAARRRPPVGDREQ